MEQEPGECGDIPVIMQAREEEDEPVMISDVISDVDEETSNLNRQAVPVTFTGMYIKIVINNNYHTSSHSH